MSLLYVTLLWYSVAAIISFVWSTLAYLKFRKVRFERLKSQELRIRYEAFERTDQQCVSYLAVAIGSILIMPIRFIIFILIAAVTLTLYSILELFTYPTGDVSANIFTRVASRVINEICIGAAFLLMGVVVKEHDRGTKPPRKASSNSFLGIPNISDSLPSNLIVSNHISIFDSVYFMRSISPGFLTKISVSRVPLLSRTCNALGCIYVDRSSKEERSRVFDELLSRRSNTGDRKKSPFVIFPEGTTSSGRQLLPFKSGAFHSLHPVLPVVLVYRCPMFSAAYDCIPALYWIALMCSNVSTHALDAYWLDVVYPPPVAPMGVVADNDTTGKHGVVDDKAQMDVNARRVQVKKFANTVRDKMEAVLLEESPIKRRVQPSSAVYPDDWYCSFTEKINCMHILFDIKKIVKSRKDD